MTELLVDRMLHIGRTCWARSSVSVHENLRLRHMQVCVTTQADCPGGCTILLRAFDLCSTCKRACRSPWITGVHKLLLGLQPAPGGGGLPHSATPLIRCQSSAWRHARRQQSGLHESQSFHPAWSMRRPLCSKQHKQAEPCLANSQRMILIGKRWMKSSWMQLLGSSCSILLPSTRHGPGELPGMRCPR